MIPGMQNPGEFSHVHVENVLGNCGQHSEPISSHRTSVSDVLASNARAASSSCFGDSNTAATQNRACDGPIVRLFWDADSISFIKHRYEDLLGKLNNPTVLVLSV